MSSRWKLSGLEMDWRFERLMTGSPEAGESFRSTIGYTSEIPSGIVRRRDDLGAGSATFAIGACRKSTEVSLTVEGFNEFSYPSGVRCTMRDVRASPTETVRRRVATTTTHTYTRWEYHSFSLITSRLIVPPAQVNYIPERIARRGSSIQKTYNEEEECILALPLSLSLSSLVSCISPLIAEHQFHFLATKTAA